MNRIQFLLLALIASYSAFAQTDQLITLKGDTLVGKTSISSNGNDAVQTVSIKNGKDKHRFKVYQVKSLIRGEDMYNTIKVNGIYQLGLVIKEGYLSLYKIMDSEVASSTGFDLAVLIKIDGSQLIVPNLGFKKHMSNFLSDCNTVVKGFEEKLYKQSDLLKIVDDYNGCVDKNTKLVNSLKVVEKKSANTDKVEQITALMEAIKQDGSLPNTDNVLEMLSDFKTKVNEGSKLPSYLTSALQDGLKSNDNYTKMLNRILE